MMTKHFYFYTTSISKWRILLVVLIFWECLGSSYEVVVVVVVKIIVITSLWIC
jgi:hypothetical protein